MIRREITLDDGSPAWLLISQIEHARLAGELARHWERGLPNEDVLLPTVFHHDDGWADWEQQPTIDPASGHPRNFTEMPNDVAHEIWRASIDQVSVWGPLAQYMVAEHFLRLRRGGDETSEPDVREFIDEYDARCDNWLKEFECKAGAAARTTAEVCTNFLQTFDAFSLMLCCTPSSKPYQLPIPGSPNITLNIDRQSVKVAPWPWTVSEKQISAVGRILPAQPLISDDQLRQRLDVAAPSTLNWELHP